MPVDWRSGLSTKPVRLSTFAVRCVPVREVCTPQQGTKMKRIALIIGAVAAATGAIAQAQQADIAIVNATVLPMTKTERLTGQTVLVKSDRIVAVGPVSAVGVPTSARRIDGTGKVLMPGLVDMHVHLAPTEGNAGDAAQRSLAVMLAYGVTTARGMAGSPGNLVVRGKLESGELAGPRFYAAAPALHDKNTTTAEQGREAVRKAKAAGFDLIKSHNLPDPVIWQAVADEARKQGIPTAGHVTNPVGLDRAMAAHQQVEHLDGTIAELIPAMAPENKIAFDQIPPPLILRLAAKRTDAQLDAFARKVAAAKSWHVPTLSLFERISDTETPTERLLADPVLRYVPAAALQNWSKQREQLKSEFTPSDAALFRDIRRRMIAAFHRAGVHMMSGSDTAQAFHLWGPGLHEEIRAFAAAGLSPIAALRTATVEPRDYFRSLPKDGSALGWKADFGTVEPGARADLILLRGDPSRDLSALRQLDTVIAGGRVITCMGRPKPG